MEIHHGIPSHPIPYPVVTMGTFDGVHQGHQKLIEQMVNDAKRINGNAVLITFHPHPKQILYPDAEPLKMIQTIEEKIKFLQTTSLDHLIILPFSLDIARWSADEFVRNVFVKGLGAKKIYMGYDHRFGKNRTGDFSLMQELGSLYHFEIHQLEAVLKEKTPISSTKIRTAISNGEIALANQMLGHPFCLSGKVIHGKKLGRTIDVPTANIQIQYLHKMIPKYGVYIGLASIEGDSKKYKAAINIGVRPTVDNEPNLHIEAHLISFNQDIYDKTLTLELVERIRDEQKFEHFDQLILQIKSDIAWVKNYSIPS